MTRNDSLFDTTPLPEIMDRAVATYGAVPVLIRALRATLRSSRPPPLEADHLPDHLRRDLGLDQVIRRRPDRVFW